MHLYRYFIIDTSGYHPFLAYVDSKEVLEVWDLPANPDQSAVLEFLFSSLGLPFHGLAVAIGPGNFSATRVGLSFAQGLALAKNIALVGYSSLEGYLTPDDQGKALLLPLGKKGGVVTLGSEISELKVRSGVGPGVLLSYEEAGEYCLQHHCHHVISPYAAFFLNKFPKEIFVEEVKPSVENIRREVVAQLALSQGRSRLEPDYRSCSAFF